MSERQRSRSLSISSLQKVIEPSSICQLRQAVYAMALLPGVERVEYVRLIGKSVDVVCDTV